MKSKDELLDRKVSPSLLADYPPSSFSPPIRYFLKLMKKASSRYPDNFKNRDGC